VKSNINAVATTMMTVRSSPSTQDSVWLKSS
jgi:hypothetical protein